MLKIKKKLSNYQIIITALIQFLLVVMGKYLLVDQRIIKSHYEIYKLINKFIHLIFKIMLIRLHYIQN